MKYKQVNNDIRAWIWQREENPPTNSAGRLKKIAVSIPLQCFFLSSPAWRPGCDCCGPGCGRCGQRAAQPDSLPHQPAAGDQRDDAQHALQPVPRLQGGQFSCLARNKWFCDSGGSRIGGFRLPPPSSLKWGIADPDLSGFKLISQIRINNPDPTFG